MKKLLLGVAVVCAVVGYSSNAARAEEEYKPTLVVQEPENVFAPMGFDDNDNAQVVLYGSLTNTCYKVGPVQTRVDREKKTIYIRNSAYHYPGCWCAEVLVPYLQTVNLGILSAGGYSVVVEKSDGTFAKAASLPIAVATSRSPDDYLYAPVESVRYNGRVSPGQLVLSGTFQNSCMTLADIKVTYRPNHVIEVQPIANMAKDDCVAEPRHFEAVVNVKDDVHGRALIHVRSLNGQSLNQVVDL